MTVAHYLEEIKIKDTDTEIRATATLCPKYLGNVAYFLGVAHILGYKYKSICFEIYFNHCFLADFEKVTEKSD